MIDESEVARLVSLAEELGVAPDQLDMAVYDADGTSFINNGGLEYQIAFLIEHNDSETVEAIIMTVDEDGNYEC